MKKTKSTQLNCFSPPIMLITLAIEFGAAFYTVWRYKMTVATRLIVGLLLGLGTFQLAEYFVCMPNPHTETWSRIGFVAISTLPAFGTHLLHVLAGKPARKAVALAYASMAAFSIFFVTYGGAFVGHQCEGNYVIFELGSKIGGMYSMTYYYPWLAFVLIMGGRWANELMRQGKKSRKRLEAVRGLMAGYLVFIVPCAIWNTMDAASRPAIPSIMCGFAVLLALILVFYILPRAGHLKK